MSDKRDKETITLGSGKLFIDEFTGTIPENSVIETEEKLLGLIQGGAEVAYAPETYTAEDDLGKVKKTILTKEEASLKSGLMTWNANALQKLVSTARVTEDKTKGIRTLKIGGIENQDGKKYVIRFLHEDKVDGNVRITIVGTNTAGFTLAFAKDKETVVDTEFKAEPCDSEGTLIIYEEEINPAA